MDKIHNPVHSRSGICYIKSMDAKATESRWINSLREQIEHLDKLDANIWSNVTVTVCLGDARRLLYILDLVRGLEPLPYQIPRNMSNDQMICLELGMLADGTMEG